MANFLPIYIVPGWTTNTSRWKALQEMLAKDGHAVTVLPIPGLTSPISTPFTLDSYISWLHSIVKNNPKKVILVGHSNGGRIAMSYAITHPDKVAHLVLIDSSGIKVKSIGKTLQNKLTTLKKFMNGKNPASKNATQLSPTPAPILKQTMNNLKKVDLLSELKKISCPTLIIWGETDKTTPLDDGYIINLTIPNSKLFVIYKARHSPQYTHPEEVYEIIRKNAF